MGFAAELRDFSEGFKTGSSFWNERARRKYQEAATEQIRTPTEEDLAGIEDPSAGGGGKVPQSEGGVDPGTTRSTGKNDVETEKIAGRLKGDLIRDFKISDIAAGGIVASLAAESGGFKQLQELAPTIPGSQGGWGYAQWTGPRRVQFAHFAEENGLDPKSYEANYGFLKKELQGPEGAILKDLEGAKDYRDATRIFTGSAAEKRGFLRPGKVNLEGRYSWADRVGGIGATGTSGGDVDTALDEQGIAKDSPARQALKDLQEDEGEEAPAAEDVSYSPEAGIPVPEEVQLSAITSPFEFAQLNDQQIRAGPPATPGDEEALPALFADSGGAIPEPQYMQAGGLPKTPLAIDYTQAPPPVAKPKPVVPAKVTPAGPTPSQLAFRRLNQPRPVTPPVAPKPVVPQQPRYRLELPSAWEQAQRLGGAGSGRIMRSLLNPATGQRERQVWGARWVPNRRYQEGGIIPDPGEQPVQMFARGGPVEDDGYFEPVDRDARFQQLLREESRGSGAGGRTGSARDRAAKRLSAEEGRPISSAYRPGRKQLAPGKGGKIKPSEPAKETTKSIDKPIEEDRLTRERRPSASAIEEDRLTRERPLPGISRNAFDVQRGAPGTEPAVPQPAIPEEASPAEVQADVDANRVKADAARQRLIDERAARRLEQIPAVNPPAALATVPPELQQPAPPVPQAPVIPEQIDLRPAPISVAPAAAAAPAPAPAPPTGPNHAVALGNAQKALVAGEDPKIIGQSLITQGIPMELWPLDLQNGFLGFAEGGMVPEPGERGYNEAIAEGATAEPQKMRATPKLLAHVGQAIDGGVKFLNRTFGLSSTGALPAPGDEVNQASGAQRMASGEGAATADEITDVDDAIDPDRRLTEGDRQMTRLAKTVQWYLERGRKDDAEAAAASLMQYGAKRFGQLGVAAEGAYREYLESGDPKDLQNTTDFLENAYQMIPDGADINITIDPQTKRLQGVRTTADGKQENYDISADEIPGLLKSVQDGSMYWNQVSRLGDPEGTKQRATQAYETAKEREKRGYEESQDVVKRERDRQAKIEEEERSAQREETRSKRDKAEAERVRLQQESFLRSRPTKPGKGDIDMGVVGPALSAAAATKAAWEADDSEENKAAYDEAASRLLDATGGDQQWLQTSGFSDFVYKGPGAAAGAGAGEPPVVGAQRMLDESGQEIWAVEDANSPSGWSKVE